MTEYNERDHDAYYDWAGRQPVKKDAGADRERQHHDRPDPSWQGADFEDGPPASAWLAVTRADRHPEAFEPRQHTVSQAKLDDLEAGQ